MVNRTAQPTIPKSELVGSSRRGEDRPHANVRPVLPDRQDLGAVRRTLDPPPRSQPPRRVRDLRATDGRCAGDEQALLAQRLELLERHGIITKARIDDERVRYTYALTDRGRELKAITDAMGAWRARWLEVGAASHRRGVRPLARRASSPIWPSSPAEVSPSRVHLADRPKEVFWLLLRQPYPEVCTTAAVREEDLIIRTSSETLARWHSSSRRARRSGREPARSRSTGARSTRRAFLRCLRPSPFAHVQPGVPSPS